MGVYEAICEALDRLNAVEIKGEHNIAAMSGAMSLLKGIKDACEKVAPLSDESQGKESACENRDGQGGHV